MTLTGEGILCQSHCVHTGAVSHKKNCTQHEYGVQKQATSTLRNKALVTVMDRVGHAA